jgi:hypothetical protein
MAIARDNIGHYALDLTPVRDIHADCDRRTTDCKISSATDCAAPLYKSATSTLAPSRAKVSAISLPMPLPAPVTMHALS